MTSESRKRLNRFFAGFSGASKSILFLDYDGTLAPFRVDRFKARPWASVRELLDEIQAQGRTQLVFVSGRPAAEILPLLNLGQRPEVWGLHGVEHVYPDGRREMQKIPGPAKRKLDGLRAQLRSDAFGALLEEKPNSVVLHWRGASRRQAQEIERKARALFEPAKRTKGLLLLEFESGLELRAGRDKGAAVRAVLSASRQRPLPAAYLGDDLTDEAAFSAIKDRGLSVLVRRVRRKTLADVWLRPPQELREFLSRWISSCAAMGKS